MRQWPVILLLLFSAVVVNGQSGLAFYHLKNATIQNSNYNPAFVPHGKFFLGLPAISGINFYVNNRFSYNDIIEPRDDNSNFVNIGGTIKKLGNNNVLSTHTNITLLHLGFRIPSGAVFSLFANERLSGDVLYPKEVAEFAWKGNAAFPGDKINFSKIGATANYYREYGIGLAYAPTGSRLKVGGRLKYLQGIVNVSTPTFFKGTIQTDRTNYHLTVEAKKGSLRTSGVELLRAGNQNDIVQHLISNGNSGFGIDLGFDYLVNKYTSFALAITDLGYISWNEDIQNTNLHDTTFRYTGIELDGAENLLDGLDSLKASFVFDTTFDKYTAMIPASIIGSITYTPFKGTDIISTINARIIHNQIKTGLGVGVRQYFGPKLILSASATRLPQQFLNVGAAFSVTAGVAQLYVAADKVFGYSVPNMQWAEFRVGLNFVFGSGKEKEKTNSYADEYKQFSNLETQSKGVTTGTFMGEKVKVKGTDGLYTDVKISDKSPAGTITPEVVNDDKKWRRILSGKTPTNDGRKVRPSFVGVLPDRILSGKTPTNDGRKVRPKSATGETQTNDGRKVEPQTATGQTKTNDGRKVRPQSATGKIKTNSGKKVKTRKPSGSGGAASKMSNRNVRRSSSGSSQQSVKKQKKTPRSATGRQKHETKKRRKN